MGCGGSSSTYAEGEEHFVKGGESIKITGKKLEGTDGTCYGAIIIDPKIPKIHQWVFKITSGGGEFLIGIDEASMKSCDKPFTPQSSYPNYAYFNGDTTGGYIYSYNISNKDSIYGKGYAIMNHCNDVITMTLDTTIPALKYSINDEYQGIAFRNIDKQCLYRMAVYMTKGKSDAVIELLNYISTNSNNNVIEEKMDSNDKGEEYFYISESMEVKIDGDGYTAVNSEAAKNTSLYGYVLIDCTNENNNGIYKWKFQINGNGKTGFGIIECNDRDTMPPKDDSYDDFFYLKTTFKNYGIESQSKCSKNESYQYGIQFGKDDIIEIILDCDGGYLSCIVNDKPQGNAYKVELNCSYRMAVVLGQDAAVELLSYHCK
eukprot:149071_1